MGAGLIIEPGAIGVDEAGRGPLAGPVAAAAVIAPDGWNPPRLNDSKKLDPAAREELFDAITAFCRVGVALVGPAEIDRVNILQASLLAMRQAIDLLDERSSERKILIDGNRAPAGLECDTVVKGDGKYVCIAAASIIAKVTRDRLMVTLARQYPEYGFDRHFGYPTPEHVDALRRFGPCPIHRRSFGPVRELTEQVPVQGLLF